MSEFDPYHVWLGIPPEEQPPHHYRLLGIPLYEDEADVIEAAADRQMAYVKTHATGQHGELSQKLLNEISAARVCLLRPEKKVEYDRELKAQLAAEEAKSQPVAARPRVTHSAQPPPESPAPAPQGPIPQIQPQQVQLQQALSGFVAPSTGESKLRRKKPLWQQPAMIAGVFGGLLALVLIIYLIGRIRQVDVVDNPDPTDRKTQVEKPPKKSNSPAPTVKKKDETPQGKIPASIPSTFVGASAGQEWDGNGLQMKFCWCPKGSFKMGEADAAVDVTLTRGFWIGKTEVTQGQWFAVMQIRPQEWGTQPDTKAGDAYPATYVSWDDTAKFCEALTKRERDAGRLPAGWEYRLPTDAQWEYACRAGTETVFSFGDDGNQMGEYAWFEKNTRYAGEAYAHQVAEKKPNPWGLHDMHGNVFEWCRDWLQKKLSGGTDPEVTTKAAFRLFRGGSWYNAARYGRSATRMRCSPDDRRFTLGFRLAAVQVGVPTPTEKKKDAPPEPAEKVPVPDAAAIENSEKLVSKLHGEELAAAKTPALRLALAKKLLDLSDPAQDDPATRYVLLVHARRLAESAGNLKLAWQALEILAGSYEIDVRSQRASTYLAIGKAIKAPAELTALIEQGLKLIEEAVAAKQYDLAEGLTDATYQFALRVRNVDLRKRVLAVRRDVEKLQKELAPVREAQVKLRQDPDDAGANLTLGKHLCFDKGDWRQGLPMLALGSDAALSGLAKEDLATQKLTGDAAAQAALTIGNHWWNQAKNAIGPARNAHKLRAGHWYEQAAPVMKGLAKAQVELRLKEIDKIPASVPSTFVGASAGQEWDGNDLKMKFCWCPKGSFKMGEADAAVDVTLTRGFWIGKTEVTQGQWFAVMKTRPKEWEANADTKAGDAYPATYVSWDDAAKFCEALTKRERDAGRLPAGWEYRLPTEAQWENACRAGTETVFSFGDDGNQMGEYAWFRENARSAGEAYAHQVADKKPNPWGLHDIHGNVWEWCRDWYKKELPGGTDPEVTTKAAFRVYRGGSWNLAARSCRSASRNWFGPGLRFNSLGFRVAAVQLSSK